MSLAQNLVIQGAADNDGQGDSGRVPFAKYNQAITELYAGAGNAAAVPSTLAYVGATPSLVQIAIGLTFTSFSIAALSRGIPLFLLAAGGIIHGIKIKHSASFAGPGVTACALSIGDINTADLYASAFDVFQAPGSRVYQLSAGLQGGDHLSATQIYLTATSIGANLNALTGGAVDIWAVLSRAA